MNSKEASELGKIRCDKALEEIYGIMEKYECRFDPFLGNLHIECVVVTDESKQVYSSVKIEPYEGDR